jgi:hypothetical protein
MEGLRLSTHKQDVPGGLRGLDRLLYPTSTDLSYPTSDGLLCVLQVSVELA